MFVEQEELKSAIYEYQLTEIIEQDDTIVDMALNAAIEEVKSYLTVNDQTNWNDGRPMYDANTIFSQTGTDRNALLMQMVKSVAKWYVCELSNVDIIEEQVQKRYDRAIEYLEKLKSGEVTISSLQTLDPASEELSTRDAFKSGSRPKFNHY